MSGLHTLISNQYASVLQDPGFRLALDTHYSFFLSPGNYDVVAVDDHLANKYRFDLNGYLTESDVSPELHYVIMRLNGMTSMTEFSYDNYKAILIPTSAAFKEVVSRFKTTLGTTV